MRRTNRTEDAGTVRDRAPMRALAWMPAHNPIPSAAQSFKRCRRIETWGRLAQAR